MNIWWISADQKFSRLPLCNAAAEKMEKYRSLVEKLTSLGIKLLAIDFDLTILNIHTGGHWQFTAKMLATRVRPCFKFLLTEVLRSKHMFVAVVTHSPQATLVRQVLEESLKDCDTNEIAIRGSDNSWKKVHGVTGEGKQQHIESVIELFEKEHKVRIKAKEVLLLDDDPKNVEVARHSKMKALEFKDDSSLDELLHWR